MNSSAAARPAWRGQVRRPLRRHAIAVSVAATLTVTGASALVIPELAYESPVRTLEAPSTVSISAAPGDRATATVEAARVTREGTYFAAESSATTAKRQGLRAGIFAVGIGLLTALGLWVRWTTQTETRRHNERNAADALEERRDARFATAIEHLANDNPSIQIGGIYTLEALAKEDPEGRSETVVQILTSYTAEDRQRRAEEPGLPADSPQHLRVAYAAAARSRQPSTPVHLAFADLTDANLSRTDLSDADLIGAKLTGAVLVGADLTDADLTGAKLTGAKLTGADLSHANLTGAELNHADLTDADLSHANVSAELAEADLSRADLQGARLTAANLSGALLTLADLTGADLTGADLTNAILTDAILARATLTGADLNHATLTSADLNHADLAGADLAGANLTRTVLTGADLTGADFTGADLPGAVLTLADLTAANLTDADLSGAGVSDADLTSTNLGATRLTAIDDFHVGLADLEETDLTGVYGFGSHPSHQQHAS